MSIRIGGKSLSLTALLGFITTAFGVLSEPSVMSLLPSNVSHGVVIAGVLIAAASKALIHTPTEAK